MDQVTNATAETTYHQNTTIPQSEPLHQYAATPPQYVQQPIYQPATGIVGEEVVTAGMMGVIVAGTGTMGANLRKVQEGEMTMAEAAGDSLVKGAVGGVAAATATAAAKSLTTGGLVGLAVTLAAATGVSYLLSR